MQLLEVVEQKDKVFLVLEFVDSDLENVIGSHLEEEQRADRRELPVAHVKTYLKMLLQGVEELHDRGILHRDLKPNNLLISTASGVAKITDFGMATFIDAQDGGKGQAEETKRSLQVVTRAYRDPQLFFGDEQYGLEVDIWSVGCIFAEMLLRRVFCDGASDIDQLSKIFTALGSPTENGWDGASKLPFYLKFKNTNPTPLAEQFPMLTPAGVDLLGKLLTLDPKKRISASGALRHEFFTEEPRTVDSKELMTNASDEATAAREETAGLVSEEAAESATDQAAETAQGQQQVNGASGDDDGNDSDGGFVIKGRRLV